MEQPTTNSDEKPTDNQEFKLLITAYELRHLLNKMADTQCPDAHHFTAKLIPSDIEGWMKKKDVNFGIDFEDEYNTFSREVEIKHLQARIEVLERKLKAAGKVI